MCHLMMLYSYAHARHMYTKLKTIMFYVHIVQSLLSSTRELTYAMMSCVWSMAIPQQAQAISQSSAMIMVLANGDVRRFTRTDNARAVVRLHGVFFWLYTLYHCIKSLNKVAQVYLLEWSSTSA